MTEADSEYNEKAERCIVDSFGGKRHPYDFCIKPLTEMIDTDRIDRKSTKNNLEGVKEAAAGLFGYTSALVSNPRGALSKDCKNVLGNRYLLKTKLKCSNGETIHKYINNVEDTFAKRRTASLGIIPAAISSVMKINAGGLIDALAGDPYPKCKRVRVPCHIVDSAGENSYTGLSNWVYITEDDFNYLYRQNILHSDGTGEFVDGRTENYTNLYETINTYLKEHPFLSKTNNEHPNDIKYKKINEFNNDPIINIYYILLCLFFLYIFYKYTEK